MMPLHPPTRTLTDYLKETAEKALLAERLGFDEVWASISPPPASRSRRR